VREVAVIHSYTSKLVLNLNRLPRRCDIDGVLLRIAGAESASMAWFKNDYGGSTPPHERNLKLSLVTSLVTMVKVLQYSPDGLHHIKYHLKIRALPRARSKWSLGMEGFIFAIDFLDDQVIRQSLRSLPERCSALP
jgi:hypothetical protein